jgi:hypothetical protein
LLQRKKLLTEKVSNGLVVGNPFADLILIMIALEPCDFLPERCKIFWI